MDNGTIVCFVIDGDDRCEEDDDDDDEIMVIKCDLSECFSSSLMRFVKEGCMALSRRIYIMAWSLLVRRLARAYFRRANLKDFRLGTISLKISTLVCL